MFADVDHDAARLVVQTAVSGTRRARSSIASAIDLLGHYRVAVARTWW